MKQLVQNLKTGETVLLEIPAPLVTKDFVLIKTSKSLVSLGTERMLVKFSKAGWFGKIRQQPERVRLITQKIKTDGIFRTCKAVSRKLNQPVALGYCNAGVILEVGEDVQGMKPGDRVVSNGSHAQIVCVNKNLVTKIPDHVMDSEATFAVIGSVALNSIKLLNPRAGETVAVIGTGLIGLLTIDLLLNKGCKVIAIDIEEGKLQIARSKGAKTFNSNNGKPVNFVLNETGNKGADGVIIAASSASDKIISEAANMCRDHGKIVLVGVIGLNINRSDFHKKELTFQVASSYGQLSGESEHHSQSIANQNFQEILELISSGELDVKSLITETVPLIKFDRIYKNIGSSQAIASILDYDQDADQGSITSCFNEGVKSQKTVIGIIGAGNFTASTLLPLLQNAHIKYIASEKGLSGSILAKKYKIEYSTTDYQQILNDKEVDLIIIATQHHLHTKMVIEALNARKHVFVEKPLALFPEDLDRIIRAKTNSHGSLTVGFNRRFSPHVQKMKSLLGHNIMNVTATMNAGCVSFDSWVHDRELGGGRIIGEACHLIDLVTFLTGSRIVSVCMNALETSATRSTDNASILLRYENGSSGVVNYFSNGSAHYAKERIEVFSGERTLILDNFKTLTGYGTHGFSQMKIPQDKGHNRQFDQLLKNIQTDGKPLIPFDEILNVTRATFAALESLRMNSWVEVS